MLSVFPEEATTDCQFSVPNPAFHHLSYRIQLRMISKPFSKKAKNNNTAVHVGIEDGLGIRIRNDAPSF